MEQEKNNINPRTFLRLKQLFAALTKLKPIEVLGVATFFGIKVKDGEDFVDGEALTEDIASKFLTFNSKRQRELIRLVRKVGKV